jgi:fimbrial chaperone protein
MSFFLQRCFISIAALFLSSYTVFSYATNSLNVSPIRFDLSIKQTFDVLTLTNDGDQPSIVQIQPYLWTKKGKADVYTKTQDLLISPPIVTIPPHSAQIIRIVLRRSPDPTTQLKYRIYAQEIPSHKSNQQGKAVQIALRFGIPVYVTPLATTFHG